MAKKHRIRGCVEVTDYKKQRNKITIETVIETVPNDEAGFFGVYEVQPDGTDEWLADFRNWDDAQMFALEKEKEETE